MADYTTKSLSLCCINGRLSNPNDRLGQNSAFVDLLGRVDRMISDRLHKGYVSDTNREIQNIYFQCFLNNQVYTKLDCLNRWIEDRERQMHFPPQEVAPRKDRSSSAGKKLANIVRSVTQSVGRQFNPQFNPPVNSTRAEVRSGIDRGDSREEHLQFLQGYRSKPDVNWGNSQYNQNISAPTGGQNTFPQQGVAQSNARGTSSSSSRS